MEAAYLLCSTILLSHFGSIPANIRCSQVIYREEKSYKLIRSRARSTLSALSRRNVSDLKKCKEFAAAKKALAFNFGRRISDGKYSKEIKIPASTDVAFTLNLNAGMAAKSEYNLANCVALGCPEVDGFADLVHDLRFDYYSLYKADDITLNGSQKMRTCVPTVGVFEFSDVPKDFTEARKDCGASGGTLAHIASPERTKLLPNLIKNDLKTDGRAFVGLSRRGKGTIWKNEFDDPLGCFDFRGWARREPRSRRGCVALDKDRTWTVVSCDKSLPFICEILPTVSATHRRGQTSARENPMKNK